MVTYTKLLKQNREDTKGALPMLSRISASKAACLFRLAWLSSKAVINTPRHSDHWVSP